jgi:hypothetical protein
MFSFTFCSDENRYPFLRWILATAETTSMPTLGKATSYGQDFRRVVTQVTNNLEAMDDAGTLTSNGSLPQRILYNVKWNGGFNGSGNDVYNFISITDANVRNDILDKNADGLNSANYVTERFENKSDDNYARAESSTRVVIYSYGFDSMSKRLLTNLNDIRTLFQRDASVDAITQDTINAFVNSSTDLFETAKVQTAFHALQSTLFYPTASMTNIVRPVGKLRVQGLPLIAFLQGIVFAKEREATFAKPLMVLQRSFTAATIESHNDPTVIAPP